MLLLELFYTFTHQEQKDDIFYEKLLEIMVMGVWYKGPTMSISKVGSDPEIVLWQCGLTSNTPFESLREEQALVYFSLSFLGFSIVVDSCYLK